MDYNYKNFNHNYQPIFNFKRITNGDYLPFNIQEIKDIICKNKNTAPGNDGISNKILKLLNNNFINILTNLFNHK